MDILPLYVIASFVVTIYIGAIAGYAQCNADRKARKKQKRKSEKPAALNTPDAYKDCTHERTYMRVTEAVATCETTVLSCLDCCTDLTNPKTDCR